MIREATAADVPALVTLGRTMRARTVYAGLLADNPAALATLAEGLIASPEGVVWVADDGAGLRAMFGARLYADPFTGARTAGQLFWYSTIPGAGIRVYLRALGWARLRGAVRMTMGVPIGADDVRDQLARLGFTALEVGYVKDLIPRQPGEVAA